ncbi:hypothetical protein G9A89_013959 [Geosiphon pyriformis]|nr:hypothetical protein G9A89_013959 [Geosiphon pyriformis]
MKGEKLPLVASGSFSLPLAGSSSPVKVPSKRHTWINPSVVSTTSKSPKIFNNRPVNKLVFPALTTPTTTSTTTTSQMAVKAKNSKKQQQTVTTAMVTPNLFVVSDEIFVAKQSINPNDLKDWADQMEMESTVTLPVSGTADGGAWENVYGCQRFSGWVASNLVSGATFKIKMTLLCSLFQLLPGCIGLKSVSQDAVKLFCVEFASQESLTGATKVAIGNKIFLTTLKIAWSSGVTSASSLFLSVALHNIPLGTSSDDIKTALGIFGVVTSDTSSTATALSHWSVLVRKDSVRILPITNQKEIISSKDIFKAKLVNLSFGCTAFEISDLVSQVGGLSYVVAVSGGKLLDVAATIGVKVSLPLSPKVPSNFSGGPKVFKSSFAGSKSYAKAAAIVVPPVAAAVDMNLDHGGSLPTITFMLPVASFAINNAVKARLASLESHFSKLSLLIKSLVEPVGALVVLVTKLLSTPPAVDVSIKESVAGLAGQNKDLAAITIIDMSRKKCEWACLEDVSDNDDMNDNDDDDIKDKDFSVYDNTFDVMMHLWEDQPSSIKSSPDLTAK